MKTLEELQDQLKSLIRKRDKQLIDINKSQEEINNLLDQIYEKDPMRVRVRCIQCNGLGYIKDNNDKKKICNICGGKKYNWMNLYVESKTGPNK